jgi:hypothetical protein
LRLLLVPAVPPHCDPDAEDQVARHVQEQHEQEPPHFDLKLEARLVLDVDPDEVERDGEDKQQDPRDALREHEQEHGGHPTAGVSE